MMAAINLITHICMVFSQTINALVDQDLPTRSQAI